MNFKQYLLMENEEDFANKVGKIYNSLNDLSKVADDKGVRLGDLANGIVGDIKIVLTGISPPKMKGLVEKMQAIAIMIKKSMDGKEKDKEAKSLPEAIRIALADMEKIKSQMGLPINDLGSPNDTVPAKDDAAVSNPAEKEKKSVVPDSKSLVEPTAPGTIPPDNAPSLGGSTGTLKNL